MRVDCLDSVCLTDSANSVCSRRKTAEAISILLPKPPTRVANFHKNGLQWHHLANISSYMVDFALYLDGFIYVGKNKTLSYHASI